MKDKLVADGYDKDKIEQQLYQLGYERGASIREEKYKVSIACKIRKETMAKCDIIQTMKPIVECFKEIDGSER